MIQARYLEARVDHHHTWRDCRGRESPNEFGAVWSGASRGFAGMTDSLTPKLRLMLELRKVRVEGTLVVLSQERKWKRFAEEPWASPANENPQVRGRAGARPLTQ
ncbi:uncharacterized protein VDAG_01130 [Verticillium dahliae VdLs.17]|uniref:Uncharacterized protein n=1 Tax=Verticillium dahliae (strain VdLs.17 / ATCC MYA-4575 / FGSC 10137) TaxID=498257 RepID=G2WTK7_VERDV|nr:uncharacterized protein VDAG_01130 [Verticillium dahliae VdLs.17]EGY17448.1 hypothetical protein VDAG_01130 [Verticillium dahliae VdLs.17]KAH6665045.1 hypothetical protein EV126DRAFT_352314 [Verticillium dahliae]KAH6701442.1 hypothetical protein EV126DRAFT_441661 [Verticillium dahliae]